MKVFEKRLAIDERDRTHRAFFSQPDSANFSSVDQFYQRGTGQPGYLAASLWTRKPAKFRRELRCIADRRDLDFLRGRQFTAALGICFTHDMLQFASGGIA